MPPDALAAKRGLETPFLEFLAVCCFIQILLGRRYLLENPAYSDIFTKSPLQHLRDMNYFLDPLDQCAVGGMLEGQFIRKRTHFQCSNELHHLHVQCPGTHKHLHLRGEGRAASSAQYTQEECERILADCRPTPSAADEPAIVLILAM